jgi:hypothetical protein
MTESKQTNSSVHPSAQFLTSMLLGERTRLFFGGRGTNVTSIDIVDGALSVPIDLGFALREDEVSTCLLLGDILVTHSGDSEAASTYSLFTRSYINTVARTLAVFPCPHPDLVGTISEEPGGQLNVSLRSTVSAADDISINISFSDIDMDSPSEACIFFETASVGHLLITCYGYCELLTLSFLDDISMTNRRTLSEGFVYDPLSIEEVNGKTALLKHVYGCGLAAIDLVAGTTTLCPHPPNTERAYGKFQRVLGSRGCADYWVMTKHGCFRWIPGQEFTQLSSNCDRAIYRDGDIFVCLHDGHLSLEVM